MIAILLYCEEKLQWETRNTHSYFHNQLGNYIHNDQQQSLAFKSLNNINYWYYAGIYQRIGTSRRPLCHTERSWSTGALALIWHIKSRKSIPQHDFGLGISTLLLLYVKAGGGGVKDEDSKTLAAQQFHWQWTYCIHRVHCIALFNVHVKTGKSQTFGR